nr:hypothetical protein [Tanacetum cinerariifolium]
MGIGASMNTNDDVVMDATRSVVVNKDVPSREDTCPGVAKTTDSTGPDSTKETMDGLSSLANIWKFEANVPYDVDYDVWLQFMSHSLDDCLKAPKRVVNRMDKDKGQTSNGECFIEVKRKKSSAKQSAEGTSNSTKTTPVVGITKSLTSGYNKDCTKSPSNKAMGNKATTSSTHEEGHSCTHQVKKIHVFEKQMLEGKLVLVDDDRKPLEKVDYPGNISSEDKVEQVDNKNASYLASKPIRV